MTILDGKGTLWWDDSLKRGGLWDQKDETPHQSTDEHAERTQCYELPPAANNALRCANCGRPHGNPAVLDLYRWCMRCCTVLKEPADITVPARNKQRDRKVLLLVLAASWGHTQDPEQAISVTNLLQDRVSAVRGKDRLQVNDAVSFVHVVRQQTRAVMILRIQCAL
jgi:ribosomal protein S14